MSWKILDRQPELRPYAPAIGERMRRYEAKKAELLAPGQTLGDFANGYLYFGLHCTGRSWIYREWAPAAEGLSLIGDFNGWDREKNRLEKRSGGSWEIELPGKDAIRQLMNYKVCVTANGERLDRIPLYANYVRQDWGTTDFSATVWAPEKPFVWHDKNFKNDKTVPPFIYEAHVGMATEEERVGTYREFADNILPRIKADGYNTVQLMAVMEHPYYGSFGYHVSNFYAVSSRCGTPDDFKYLVDRAHALGLRVVLDLIHSHAVKNVNEGIDRFDGSDTQFFKSGEAGWHRAWDSRVFDYGKNGVLHFLLSNLKFWLEEYHVDGFRFDGVGSMLYHNHGLGMSFTGLDCYFGANTDLDAVTYLQLACELVREVKPSAILIAEDVSAMPGLCLPVQEGGIGFDYRLSMGLPDFYIRMIKVGPVGAWDMGQLCWELTAHRNGEKRIAYAESHDQALVGDQTLMFRLAGAEIYTSMDKNSQSPRIERAMRLHKLIRLITVCAGGDGYLNFMGNEFGHPDWIDFPREGNGWSHCYARRQWSLADNSLLRYSQLGEFDRAMISLMRDENVLCGTEARCIVFDQEKQLLAFRRGAFLFAFNFHPGTEQPSLLLPASVGSYALVLYSEAPAFGASADHPPTHFRSDGTGISIPLPPLSAVAIKKM